MTQFHCKDVCRTLVGSRLWRLTWQVRLVLIGEPGLLDVTISDADALCSDLAPLGPWLEKGKDGYRVLYREDC